MVSVKKMRRRLVRGIAALKHERAARMSRLEFHPTRKLKLLQILSYAGAIAIVLLAVTAHLYLYAMDDGTRDRMAMTTVLMTSVVLVGIVAEYCIFVGNHVADLLDRRQG